MAAQGVAEGRMEAPAEGGKGERGEDALHTNLECSGPEQPQEDDREEATDAEHWKEAFKLS